MTAWPIDRPLEALAAGVAPLNDRPRSTVRGGVAFLPTLPRVRLVVVGAGHVGQGVASLAAQADFDVWIVDDRHQYANAERFPTAQRIIVGPIDEVLPNLEITPQTYALIVTRGHGHDQEALYHLASTCAPYVGLIGSRRKIRLIFDNLREQGILETDLARVTAPVGFDIGSQTIPEIAISIVAELIARRNLGPAGLAPHSVVTAVPTSATADERERVRPMIPAIVPAAGRSARMGRPKLLLPIDGVSVIARVITALRIGGADLVVVVVPACTIPGASDLAAEAEQAGACVVVADPPPPDIGASVEWGLDRLGRMEDVSTVLIVPGDSPGITADLVAQVIKRAGSEPQSIIIPASNGRRGHPIALPWALVTEIRELPSDVGINALVRRHADEIIDLDVADPDALADLDTPYDYRRWADPGG